MMNNNIFVPLIVGVASAIFMAVAMYISFGPHKNQQTKMAVDRCKQKQDFYRCLDVMAGNADVNPDVVRDCWVYSTYGAYTAKEKVPKECRR